MIHTFKINILAHSEKSEFKDYQLLFHKGILENVLKFDELRRDPFCGKRVQTFLHGL
jgi:hypothetical protein